MKRLRARGAGQDRQAGVTLAELLVTMVITVVFFSVFSSIAVKMFDATNTQQARADNLDTTRNLVEVLDRQVRYANAINTPVTTGTGTVYVTWRAGSINSSGIATTTTGAQTCYQWQVTTGMLMQYRSWKQGTTAATAWRTAGNGIVAVSGSTLFSIGGTGSATQQNRQQLTVSFASSHGVKAVTTPSTVAFTALNTRTSSAPATPVCTEVTPPA